MKQLPGAGFQFHIGAIRRSRYNDVVLMQYTFQFHIGAIRRWADNSMWDAEKSFNSILVQLEAIHRKGGVEHGIVSIPYWCN